MADERPEVATLRTLTTPARYMAVPAGAGLIGYAIAGAVGFVMGLGVGLIVLCFAVWLARRIDAWEDFAEPRPVRISLDQADFARLVRGEVVGHPGGVRIALRDIGWTVMLAEIQRAYRDAKEASDVR